MTKNAHQLQKQAVKEDAPHKGDGRPTLRKIALSVLRTVVGVVILLSGLASLLAVSHPDSPLPDAWNPLAPLAVTDDVTPLTSWKLTSAANDPELCLTTLAGDARIASLPPLDDSPQCFIRNRVTLSGVGQADLRPVETRCAIALRLAMWEAHALQPASQDIFGQPVTRIRHLGSFSCRPLRTTQGNSSRMSTHATASAIDIAGFELADGRDIDLLTDWGGADAEAEFLKRVRDGACDWFRLTLSPDFNRLHANHFHLQAQGWGGCR